MISVKEYASSRGKTHQAVYKQLKSQKNKEMLEGHTFTVNGRLCLDDVAVKVLDDASSRSPVVVLQGAENEKVEEMQKQLEGLKDTVIELQKQLLESQKQLIEANYNIGMLESKEEERKCLKDENTTLCNEVAQLKEELETEKNKSWLQKLLRK